MINFLMENGEDVYNGFNSQNQFQEKIFQLPFDQDLKRKTVVRVDGANDEMCRVYVKGAPEEIISVCTQTLDAQVNPREFTARDQQGVLNIVESQIAAHGYKPLSYGFKMVNNAELSKVLSKVDEDSLEYRNIFESNLIYLGTFGLEDPLREGIMDDINTMQWGSKEGK